MKYVFQLVLFLSLHTFSNQLFAASGSSYGKVTTLLWYQGHSGLLLKQEGMSDLGNCGRADYYILDDQHPFLKKFNL